MEAAITCTVGLWQSMEGPRARPHMLRIRGTKRGDLQEVTRNSWINGARSTRWVPFRVASLHRLGLHKMAWELQELAFTL